MRAERHSHREIAMMPTRFMRCPADGCGARRGTPRFRTTSSSAHLTIQETMPGLAPQQLTP